MRFRQQGSAPCGIAAGDRTQSRESCPPFADIRTFFDANGNLIPIHQLDAKQRSCLAALEVLVKNAKPGHGHTAEVHKFKLWDKMRALEASRNISGSSRSVST